MKRASRPLPSLTEQAETVCAAIRARPALLKIVLKTKDESFFIADWIRHHAAIVGIENLLILDNGSTDAQVHATYAAHGDALMCAHFDGLCDDIHIPWKFPDLYAALCASAAYFLFIDTDEFLVFKQGDAFIADASILQALTEATGDFVPVTRLANVDLAHDRFITGLDGAPLLDGLKWGKPIIRSVAREWPNLVNHNVQLRGALEPDAQANFFLLHRNRADPEQRIRANMAKLIDRKWLSPDETLGEALTRDPSTLQPFLRAQLDEIRVMLALRETPPAPELRAGEMRVGAGGAVAFGSPETAGAFGDFQAQFSSLARQVVTPPPPLQVDLTIEDHRLVNCAFQQSPNHGGEITPLFVVMHFTATFDAAEAIKMLCDARAPNRVSAHVVLGADGALTQLLPFNVEAWHAGQSAYSANGQTYTGLNAHSIGVEIVNPGWFVMRDGVLLHEGRKPCPPEKFSLFPGAIDAPLPDGAPAHWTHYPLTQMDVLEKLTRKLLSAYPSIQYIVGHDEIAPIRKVDPGPAFPMARFKRLVGAHRG